jgi:hypothetical protein
MTNPNSPQFSAFPTTVGEEDGEIVPVYGPGNGNQPRRAGKHFDGISTRQEDEPSTFQDTSEQPTALTPTDLIVGMREGLAAKTDIDRDRKIREAVYPTTARNARPLKD